MTIFCTTNSPCNNPRTCDTCAGRRQARIADQAAQLALIHHQIYLQVIVPMEPTPEAIKRARAHIVRYHEARAGLWTVESGSKFGGLHLNIMTPYASDITPPNCRNYADYQPANPRNTAAYISKRAGMPSREQFAGNLYGSWNHISRRLSSNDASPIVQAASLNSIIQHHTDGRRPEIEPANGSPDRELARQNLAYLHDLLKTTQRQKPP